MPKAPEESEGFTPPPAEEGKTNEIDDVRSPVVPKLDLGKNDPTDDNPFETPKDEPKSTPLSDQKPAETYNIGYQGIDCLMDPSFEIDSDALL